MAAPTKTAAIAIQQNMESKQVAAANNKAKPLLSSQESGKTAGSLARNKSEMHHGDSIANRGTKAPPPMAVAALQQNTKNIGENLGDNRTKPLLSSQESGKSAGWVPRNKNMRSEDANAPPAGTVATAPPDGSSAAARLAANVPQLKAGATSLQKAIAAQELDRGAQRSNRTSNQEGTATATATVKATANGTASATSTATATASAPGNRSTGSGGTVAHEGGRGDHGGRGRGGRGRGGDGRGRGGRGGQEDVQGRGDGGRGGRGDGAANGRPTNLKPPPPSQQLLLPSLFTEAAAAATAARLVEVQGSSAGNVLASSIGTSGTDSRGV